MRAYCWASGRIDFGRRVPDGALPIARGPKKKVHDFIETMSRHAYDGETLLVPGVPEALDQGVALDALQAWLDWIRGHAPAGVEVM